MKEFNKEKILVTICIIAFLFVSAVIGWAKYFDEIEEVEVWQTRYSEAIDELRDVKEEKHQLSLTLNDLPEPYCSERIEFLEGQLESCNRAYLEERHDRKFYQNALDEIPAYCPEGLYELTIAGLVDERNYCWGILDRIRERRGTPCHPHPDGIHCGWEPCTMLYDCAFGELGWIGPDRVMCDEFGNTRYNEARSVCYSDRNCSNCLEMTKGDLGHCYAFAYYP